MAGSAQDQDRGSSSLRRALRLLDSFSPERPELTIRELAQLSGTPRTTTHRLAQDLLEWGALERGSRGLRLGVKLFELGTLAPSQITLNEAATGFLHTLNEVTKLTTNLAIREGSEIVYVVKIGTDSLHVPHSRLGGRGYLHATALGKAILAFTPSDVVDEVLPDPLPIVTPRTITDPGLLRTELASVRRERRAYDLEESRLGLFCVAAPILDKNNAALAAVSVTGATAFSQAERFAPVVMATAQSISRRLSTRPQQTSR